LVGLEAQRAAKSAAILGHVGGVVGGAFAEVERSEGRGADPAMPGALGIGDLRKRGKNGSEVK
jgi:hypothetical protein